MHAVSLLYPGVVSGVLHAGFIILLFLSLRLLPAAPQATWLKRVSLFWLLANAVWLLIKTW